VDRSGGAARGDRSGGDHHRPAGVGAVLEPGRAGPVRVESGRGPSGETSPSPPCPRSGRTWPRTSGPALRDAISWSGGFPVRRKDGTRFPALGHRRRDLPRRGAGRHHRGFHQPRAALRSLVFHHRQPGAVRARDRPHRDRRHPHQQVGQVQPSGREPGQRRQARQQVDLIGPARPRPIGRRRAPAPRGGTAATFERPSTCDQIPNTTVDGAADFGRSAAPGSSVRRRSGSTQGLSRSRGCRRRRPV
jgi:hypothetical protein